MYSGVYSVCTSPFNIHRHWVSLLLHICLLVFVSSLTFKYHSKETEPLYHYFMYSLVSHEHCGERWEELTNWGCHTPYFQTNLNYNLKRHIENILPFRPTVGGFTVEICFTAQKRTQYFMKMTNEDYWTIK